MSASIYISPNRDSYVEDDPFRLHQRHLNATNPSPQAALRTAAAMRNSSLRLSKLPIPKNRIIGNTLLTHTHYIISLPLSIYTYMYISLETMGSDSTGNIIH